MVQLTSVYDNWKNLSTLEPLILRYLIWKCFTEIKIYSPYPGNANILHLERGRVGFSFAIISNVVDFWMAVKPVLKIASLSFADKVIDGDCQNSTEVIIKKSWGIVANTNLIRENYVGNFPGGPAVRTLSFLGRGHGQPKIKKERKEGRKPCR